MPEWTRKRPDEPGVYWLAISHSSSCEEPFLVKLSKEVDTHGEALMTCEECLIGHLTTKWMFDPNDESDELYKNYLWAKPQPPSRDSLWVTPPPIDQNCTDDVPI